MLFVVFSLLWSQSHRRIEKLQLHRCDLTQSSLTIFSPPQLSVPGLSTTPIQAANSASFCHDNVDIMSTPANIKIVNIPNSHEVRVRRADGVVMNVTLTSAPLIPGPSEIPLPPTPLKQVSFADSELTRKEKDELDEEDSAMIYGQPSKNVGDAKLKKAKKLVARRVAASPEVAAFRAMKKGRKVSYQEARATEQGSGEW